MGVVLDKAGRIRLEEGREAGGKAWITFNRLLGEAWMFSTLQVRTQEEVRKHVFKNRNVGKRLLGSIPKEVHL